MNESQDSGSVEREEIESLEEPGTDKPVEEAVPKADEPVIEMDAVPEETATARDSILSALQPMQARLETLEQMVIQVSREVGDLRERVTLIPRQVRQLGSKVDDITESISQPRIRDLLNSLLLLYDLVEQMGRTAAEAHNYEVLGDQIAQVLEVNGLHPITESQDFDPTLHRAIETVACETPEENGEIVSVYRSGFRTNRATLRYAEVVVKRYQEPKNKEIEL